MKDQASPENTRALRRWLWGLMRPRLWRVLLLMAGEVISSLTMVGLALLSKAVVDAAIAGELARLGRLALLLVALIVARTALPTGFRAIQTALETDMGIRLRVDTLNCLLTRDSAAIASYHSGKLLERLTQDSAQICRELTALPLSMVAIVTRLAASVSALWALDWRLPAVMVVIGLAFFGGARLLSKSLKERTAAMRKQTENTSAFYQETLQNRMVIKSFRAETRAAARAALLEGRYREAWRRWRNLFLCTGASFGLFFQTGYFVALLLCAWELAQGRLTAGGLTAVLQLVSQVQEPFASLSGLVPRYTTLMTAAERLSELHVLPSEQADAWSGAETAQLGRQFAGLQAQGLVFGYGRDEVLRGVDFELKRGEFAVLMGESGAGKTTLMKLMLGVYSPQAGQWTVSAGDKSITAAQPPRGLFGYVPQGNGLLSGTLRDNLTFLSGEKSEEEIRRALTIACADVFVDALPEGLDTVLGEKGQGISEGQGQRLAIARALLCDAPVLLLDEATSALDAETEQQLLHRLREDSGRTLLLVTHRPSAIELCDRVWRLENGRLTQQEGALI